MYSLTGKRLPSSLVELVSVDAEYQKYIWKQTIITNV